MALKEEGIKILISGLKNPAPFVLKGQGRWVMDQD